MNNIEGEIITELCEGFYHRYNILNSEFCVMIINNITKKCNLLKHTHNKVFNEIDIEKTLLMDINKFDLKKKLTKEKIENITFGSHTKLWFKCMTSKCGCIHSYEATSVNRTRSNIKNPTGCPYCCSGGPNKKMCSCFSNSFMNDPILAKEWDYEKNGNINPWNLLKYSDEIFWWICRDHFTCKEHSWKASIKSRTKGSGCPFCNGIGGACQTCICNSLSRTHPRLCKDIPKHLNPTINLEKISYGSDQIINYECYLCKFNWSTKISARTHFTASERCPQCNSNISDFEYNCKEILLKLNQSPIMQHKLHCISSRKYDFIFQYNNIVYLIVTDGRAHWVRNKCWHPTEEIFIERQNTDKIKTIIPIFYNYVIMRLSNDKYSEIENNIKYLLNVKLNKPTIIFDDIMRYNYITNDIFRNQDKVDYLIDTFVDLQYREEVKKLYKTTNFDIIDIKSNRLWTNYI